MNKCTKITTSYQGSLELILELSRDFINRHLRWERKFPDYVVICGITFSSDSYKARKDFEETMGPYIVPLKKEWLKVKRKLSKSTHEEKHQIQNRICDEICDLLYVEYKKPEWIFGSDEDIKLRESLDALSFVIARFYVKTYE